MTEAKATEKSEIILLTPEQAESLLVSDDEIHCYMNTGNILTGADWSRESVIEQFQNAEKIEIGGETCMRMGHGIVVYPPNAKWQSQLMFFSHDEAKMSDFISYSSNQSENE